MSNARGARTPALAVGACGVVAGLVVVALVTGSPWPWVLALAVATPLAIAGVLRWIARP